MLRMFTAALACLTLWACSPAEKAAEAPAAAAAAPAAEAAPAAAAGAPAAAEALAAAPLPEGAQRTLLPAPSPDALKSLKSSASLQSNDCSAPSAGACGGCSISCPSNKAAYCSTGLTDWRPMNGGGAPICVQPAYCYCS